MKVTTCNGGKMANMFYACHIILGSDLVGVLCIYLDASSTAHVPFPFFFCGITPDSVSLQACKPFFGNTPDSVSLQAYKPSKMPPGACAMLPICCAH
jgi:hypothetical protein